MSIVIARYPQTTDNGHVCKFSRAGNPMYYQINRRDVEITGISQIGGFYCFTVADPSIFSLNESVYFCTLNGSTIIDTGTAIIIEIGVNYIVVFIWDESCRDFRIYQ